MTPQTKGTIQRIVAGLVTAVLVAIITAVVTTRDRVSTLEIKVKGVEDGQNRIEQSMERNRIENREDHQRIIDEIRGQKK